MALQRTGHRTLREYQSQDINDTKRVSDVLSSTRVDNAEICEKQQICVAIVIISKTLVLTCLMNLM